MNDLYVIAYEAGAANTPVAVWASAVEDPMQLLRSSHRTLEYLPLMDLPGAFHLLDLFSQEECEHFISQSVALGYTDDAAISLPRSVRHNQNCVWIVDDTTHDVLWERCKPFMNMTPKIFEGKKAVGLNKRFRFYKYEKGDYFNTHTDGSWSGSRVVNGKLIANAYAPLYSQMTFLLFLSDDYEGGETSFQVNGKEIDIRTPKGGVLCFPHGTHPLHALHRSKPIISGVKYIIRSDVLFQMSVHEAI